MPANYVLLEKITVGAAGASSVTFSGIPQTGYTDLVVKFSCRTNENPGASALGLQINGASTTLTVSTLRADGASASSNTQGGVSGGFGRMDSRTGQASDTTANTFANQEIYFPNYTSANYKSFSNDGLTENNATAAYSEFNAGLWSNTAAITSLGISVYGGGGSFVQYSTFYLYGVAKLGTTPAIVPYATGGDTIMTDGTYWYHTFISSGTFTPQKALSCDYLVVAGGAGGGSLGSAGGGAGGLRSTVTATGGGGSLETALSLGTSAYTVTVGAGGAGGASGGNNVGTNGSNSVFSTITSTGGGGGGAGGAAGSSGGSGGGAGRTNTSPGTGTSNQGFAGSSSGGFQVGGGGGGAGAVGTAASTNNGANGGAGVATSISGSSVTYAGGGGAGVLDIRTAGTGGSGGGGAGGTGNGNNNGSAGTANLGGGGGGSSVLSGFTSSAGGAGGSGIVIVRYAV